MMDRKSIGATVEMVEVPPDNEVLLFVSQPSGDWFHLTTETEYEPETKQRRLRNAWLERVVVWHHVKSNSAGHHIQGIGSSGVWSDPEDNGWEGLFVRGNDRAPNGQLWADIYTACYVRCPGVHRISDLSVFDSKLSNDVAEKAAKHAHEQLFSSRRGVHVLDGIGVVYYDNNPNDQREILIERFRQFLKQSKYRELSAAYWPVAGEDKGYTFAMVIDANELDVDHIVYWF